MAKTKAEINPLHEKRLRDALDANHMTQKELSDITGVSAKTISNICNGRAALSRDCAVWFAKALPPFSAAWLLGETDEIDEAASERLYRNRRRQALSFFLANLPGYEIRKDIDGNQFKGYRITDENGREMVLTIQEVTPLLDELCDYVDAFAECALKRLMETKTPGA